eukprot:jgi/Mesen1/1302/ME000013S00800
MAFSSVALLALVASFVAVASAQVFGGASSVNQLEPACIRGYRGGKIGAYDSVGSGAGIAGFATGKYLIAASDAPMTSAEDRKAGAKYTLPQVFSSYSIFVSAKAGLRLSPAQVYKIYSGAIRTWNQIPGSGLKGTIIPVARAEGSGTTEVFTKWLQKSSSGIRPAFVGLGPYKFGNPSQITARGTAALAAAVKSRKTAIGYGQTGIVIKQFRNFEVAVLNPTNRFVLATQSDLSQSIPRSLPPSNAAWGGVNLINVRGEKTFPICSFVFLFAKQDYRGPSQPGLVKPFLTYLMSRSAQALSKGYFFQALPTSIANKNLAAIKLIK